MLLSLEIPQTELIKHEAGSLPSEAGIAFHTASGEGPATRLGDTTSHVMELGAEQAVAAAHELAADERGAGAAPAPHLPQGLAQRRR